MDKLLSSINLSVNGQITKELRKVADDAIEDGVLAFLDGEEEYVRRNNQRYSFYLINGHFAVLDNTFNIRKVFCIKKSCPHPPSGMKVCKKHEHEFKKKDDYTQPTKCKNSTETNKETKELNKEKVVKPPPPEDDKKVKSQSTTKKTRNLEDLPKCGSVSSTLTIEVERALRESGSEGKQKSNTSEETASKTQTLYKENRRPDEVKEGKSKTTPHLEKRHSTSLWMKLGKRPRPVSDDDDEAQ